MWSGNTVDCHGVGFIGHESRGDRKSDGTIFAANLRNKLKVWFQSLHQWKVHGKYETKKAAIVYGEKASEDWAMSKRRFHFVQLTKYNTRINHVRAPLSPSVDCEQRKDTIQRKEAWEITLGRTVKQGAH